MLQIDKFTLYLVTDRQWLNGRSLAQAVEEAIHGGVEIVQLREKGLTNEEYTLRALPILNVCRKYGVPLIINDNIEVAHTIGADGVHLGTMDGDISHARDILGKNAIIGASARTIKGALFAQKQGADYLGVGAVFGTSTKSNAQTIDINTLIEIVNACTLPIFAIGGVNVNNITKLKGIGLAGAAVVSAILNADNIKSATERLLHSMK